jgi:hypothetical protein
MAKERIAALLFTAVTVSAAHESSITWKVVEKVLWLSFLNWKEKFDAINEEIMASKRLIKKFVYDEFLVGLGLLIGAAEFSQCGNELFSLKYMSSDSDHEDDVVGGDYWPSICPSPKFEQFMSFSQFKECRSLQWISCDESMLAWKPRKTALGGLPDIFFISRKPKQLGKNNVISIHMTY